MTEKIIDNIDLDLLIESIKKAKEYTLEQEEWLDLEDLESDKILEEEKKEFENTKEFKQLKKHEDDYDKAMNFIGEAMVECEKFYPKHFKTLTSLWINYMRIFYDFKTRDSEIYKKFLHYLYEFSDFIAKKYFPDEIDEDWRRPIKLEDLINNAMFERLDKGMKEDQDFKNEIIEGLQTEFKDNPFAELLTGIMIGGGMASTEELAEAMDISKENINKQIKKMSEKGDLKEGKDYIQTDLDYFKEV